MSIPYTGDWEAPFYFHNFRLNRSICCRPLVLLNSDKNYLKNRHISSTLYGEKYLAHTASKHRYFSYRCHTEMLWKFAVKRGKQRALQITRSTFFRHKASLYSVYDSHNSWHFIGNWACSFIGVLFNIFNIRNKCLKILLVSESCQHYFSTARVIH